MSYQPHIGAVVEAKTIGTRIWKTYFVAGRHGSDYWLKDQDGLYVTRNRDTVIFRRPATQLVAAADLRKIEGLTFDEAAAKLYGMGWRKMEGIIDDDEDAPDLGVDVPEPQV